MLEGRFHIRPYQAEASSSAKEHRVSDDILPLSAALPAIQKLAEVYDTTLDKMQRLAYELPKPANKKGGIYQPTSYAKPRPRKLQLLPSSLNYLNTLQKHEIPLLPAPPSFESVFARFEPMFHTVFYRKYPAERLADAKQDALLHLWKLWKADMWLFDQSAAYVIQAALWGASPTRKVQKERRRQQHELPMMDYTRYIDIHLADTSRDQTWTQHIDRRVDIYRAVQRVREMLQSDGNSDDMLDVLQDIVYGRSRTVVRRTSKLGWRGYGRVRDHIEALLREALDEYAPQPQKQPVQPEP